MSNHVITWLPLEGRNCVIFFFLNSKSLHNYINPEVQTTVKSSDGAQNKTKKEREWWSEIILTMRNKSNYENVCPSKCHGISKVYYIVYVSGYTVLYVCKPQRNWSWMQWKDWLRNKCQTVHQLPARIIKLLMETVSAVKNWWPTTDSHSAWLELHYLHCRCLNIWLEYHSTQDICYSWVLQQSDQCLWTRTTVIISKITKWLPGLTCCVIQTDCLQRALEAVGGALCEPPDVCFSFENQISWIRTYSLLYIFLVNHSCSPSQSPSHSFPPPSDILYMAWLEKLNEKTFSCCHPVT